MYVIWLMDRNIFCTLYSELWDWSDTFLLWDWSVVKSVKKKGKNWGIFPALSISSCQSDNVGLNAYVCLSVCQALSYKVLCKMQVIPIHFQKLLSARETMFNNIFVCNGCWVRVQYQEFKLNHIMQIQGTKLLAKILIQKQDIKKDLKYMHEFWTYIPTFQKL